ncbi:MULTISPECIES: restriction endonuclease subunit S [Streptomyces]|uniref:restriction endonuclease subunit S n=1 Tax=Streptomyces TaxID=1883 RepID=UPI000ABB69B1|nr:MULTISPECIES: restriction endonuclease subunit S [Streptomyces]MDX2680299.1 restriction endonuclease subunit S [Streptomyces sp. NY05-11A]MDX3112893.1 restriction endonuclease subunit S [Streptomyces scabiei]MDX3244887.1 restriction endonuclease subunit S [Streptomyces sp. ME18-1-4]MDX3542538.1 restriction endonuclease subunit S [Streptomyces europaeiscabiei]
MSDWQQISLGGLESPVRRKVVAVPPQGSRASASDGYPLRALGEVMRLDIQRTPMKPATTYRLAGVLNAGKGVVAKGELDGGDTEYAAMNVLRADQVVMRKLTAWEGPITVVPAEFDGFVVSNEFPTFTLGPEVMPDWMRHVCGSPRLWAEMKNRVSGTVQRRKRLNPEQLLQIQLPIPPREVQTRIVEVLDAVDDQINALRREAEALARIHDATRESLLKDAPLTPLSDVCELTARLVDPRLEEYADLTHVGVETIAKGTGEIVGARTAREDKIISGKFLFCEGDVIYSKIRPALRKVAVPGFSGLCSADAYPLRPKGDIPASLLREVLLQERVVESAVSMAGRTKMPKVNRKQLFSIQVAMPCPDSIASVDAALSALRGHREAVVAEAARLREVRVGLLAGLLDRAIDIVSAELGV